MRPGRGQRLLARPLQQITVDGRGLVSRGDQPEILLESSRGSLPRGWVALYFDAPLARPVVYVDTAAGDSFAWPSRPRWPRWTRRRCRVVHLPGHGSSLRVRPAACPGPFAWGEVRMRAIGRAERGCRLVQHVLRLAIRDPGQLPVLLRRAAGAWRRGGLRGIRDGINRELLGAPLPSRTDYHAWARRFDTVNDEDRRAIHTRLAGLPRTPTITLFMRVERAREDRLHRTVRSVLDQLYPRWELHVVLAPSAPPEVRRVLEQHRAASGGRIRIEPARPDERAAPLAGEFIGRLGAEDVLPEHALFMVAEELGGHPDVDVVYTDEDLIDDGGRRADPRFKPEWNPELFCSQNYLGRLVVHRASLLPGPDGNLAPGNLRRDEDEYAAMVRVIARSRASRIRHLPHVLYHRRYDPERAADDGADAAAAALGEWLASRGSGIEVAPMAGAPGRHRVRAPVPAAAPLVSLIVPSRDRRRLLEACVESILAISDYPNLEVVVVDNESRDPDALDYLARLTGHRLVRVLRDDRPFNFSALVNRGARSAAGALLGFVNNDVTAITAGWLPEMVGHALRSDVGAVGAKLYYPDATIQHAGIVIGIHGICGHVHRGRARDAIGYCGRARAVQEVSAVTAACLVVRRRAFEEVGGFDEDNLPIAFNDIDLCLRLRERGYRTVWTPWAELFHHEGASRGLDHLASERFAREIAYMKARWAAELAADPCYNPNLSLDDEDFGLAFPPRVTKSWRRDGA